MKSSFCVYGIIFSTNKGQLDFFFFPICNPLVLFSCLMSLAEISRVILNSSSEYGHSHLVPNVGGNASNFSHAHSISMMLAVGISYIALIILKNYPSIHNFLFFIMKGCCILSNAFGVSDEYKK